MENKTVACEACGEPVSKAAKACPHCGHPVSMAMVKTQAIAGILWSLGLVLIFGWIAGHMLGWW
jgi:hypothetical protein